MSTVNLDINRIGLFINNLDLIELEDFVADRYLKKGKINKVAENNYCLVDLKLRRLDAVKNYFYIIMNTNSTVKASQFAVDMTPRIITSCLLEDNSSIFTRSLTLDANGDPMFDIDHLVKIIKNRGHKLKSDLLIGYRSGFLCQDNEKSLLDLDGKSLSHKNGEVSIKISSVGNVRNEMIKKMEEII